MPLYAIPNAFCHCFHRRFIEPFAFVPYPLSLLIHPATAPFRATSGLFLSIISTMAASPALAAIASGGGTPPLASSSLTASSRAASARDPASQASASSDFSSSSSRRSGGERAKEASRYLSAHLAYAYACCCFNQGWLLSSKFKQSYELKFINNISN